MNVFRIIWATVVIYLLPGRLRQRIHTAWCNLLVVPAVYLKGLFDNNRAKNLYNLTHTSQVCYMQAVLNDAFDNTLRRITITDGVYVDPVYIYKKAELKPVYIYKTSENKPIALYSELEIDTSLYDFTVNVPAALAYDVARMKALINGYKLPGKTWQIATF